MKHALVLIVTVVMLLISAGCQPKQENNFVSGPGDMEPTHFETEQDLVAYLKSLSGDEKINYCYRLANVPVDMNFESYSSYFRYVDWWFYNPNISEEARFIYLRWYFSRDGQELLENDLNENGAGRIKLKIGDKTYYYLLVDESDVGWPKLYDIEWLQDGFLFGINIPEDYIASNGKLEETLLLKYTELNQVHIE